MPMGAAQRTLRVFRSPLIISPLPMKCGRLRWPNSPGSSLLQVFRSPLTIPPYLFFLVQYCLCDDIIGHCVVLTPLHYLSLQVLAHPRSDQTILLRLAERDNELFVLFAMTSSDNDDLIKVMISRDLLSNRNRKLFHYTPTLMRLAQVPRKCTTLSGVYPLS